jgi:2-polyprenyl-6-methoxyphenol hydroxylase-like FAD-dependent oxidoreductase
MATDDKTSVLIAGAGPVGLTLSIELGLRGIDCVLTERGDGIPRVPRMSSVSARGMEFCRRWGIADEVRYAVWSKTHPLDFVYVSTMVGEELARLRIGSYAERQGKMDYSPEGAASCPQIFFDPILAEKAKSVPGVSVRYGTRLVGFEQFETGVRATLADTGSGEERSITADYLVGCDGAGGIVRRTLGIPLDGLGPIAPSVNVFFRSAEFAAIHDKGWAHIYRFFDDDGCWAELIAIDGKELWRLSVFHDAAPDLTGESYLRKLAGRDFAYEILDVSPWERRDFLARSYRQGRVLIAGDAAHEMSPTAGAGMHTGMCPSAGRSPGNMSSCPPRCSTPSPPCPARLGFAMRWRPIAGWPGASRRRTSARPR